MRKVLGSFKRKARKRRNKGKRTIRWLINFLGLLKIVTSTLIAWDSLTMGINVPCCTQNMFVL